MINHRNSKKVISALKHEKIIKLTKGYFPGDHSNTYEFYSWVLEYGFEKHLDPSFSKKSLFQRGDTQEVERLLTCSNPILQNSAKNLLRIQLPSFESLDPSGKSHFETSCRQFAIDNLRGKRIYCFFDRWGRLHSNFTNLPRDLRARATVQDAPLHSLDIKSCYPTLLWGHIRSPIEKEKYSNWLASGQFYEQLMKRAGYGSAFRDMFKKHFNAWLNGGRQPEIYAAMRTEFPDLFTIIYYINKEDYRALGHSLMRLEGKIILQTVLADFWEKHPDSFALSVHDAIYTIKEHGPYLKSSIENAVFHRIGIKPQIEISENEQNQTIKYLAA